VNFRRLPSEIGLTSCELPPNGTLRTFNRLSLSLRIARVAARQLSENCSVQRASKGLLMG
jgi:hypothetical protein